MKKITVITAIIISLSGCHSEKDQHFKQVLKDNLEAMRTVQYTFNERNIPLKIILDQSRIDKYGIDKSQFTLIDSMTEVLDQKLTHQTNKLIIEKENTTEKVFYEAIIEYLKFIRDLENDLTPFLKSIEDTIIENEEELSIPVREKALRINTEMSNWRRVEQDFYDKYDIKQKMVDSLENTFKR